MTAWRALAGPVAVGQGRSREAVARPATALTGWRWSGLFATSGLSISGKVWADGDWIIDIIHVLSKTYGNGVWEKTQKLKTLQPHAPSRRRCFLSCHPWLVSPRTHCIPSEHAMTTD